MATYKSNGLEVSNGNMKLGENTLIFNMGPATDCPSKARGLCKVPAGRCYALKAEKNYPAVLPYRKRQADYWLNTAAQEIITDLDQLLARFKALRRRVKYFRFNEAGDFYGQDCIEKLSTVARHLKKHYSILTYGYTARADLDFNSADFKVKGSGHAAGNNGSTRVITNKADRQSGEVICPGSCKTCKVCKLAKSINVAFLLH